MWIDRGELAFPVEEVTIAGNLADLLNHIEMVGSDLEFRSALASPTLLVTGLTVAGT
jgi:PmbA protein